MDEQNIEFEPTPTIKIGDYLKEKREEKGYTLKIISQHTRINATLLDKLERNRLEELPSKAYVTGFVKSYAKTLGLDESETLSILNQTYDVNPHVPATEKTISQPSTSTPKLETKNENNSEATSNNTMIAPIAIIAVALILVLAAIFSSGEGNKEKVATNVVEKSSSTPITPKKVTATTPLVEKTQDEINQKAAEAKRLADEKAAAEKLEAEAKAKEAAEEKRLAAEKAAAEAKAKEAAEKKRLAAEQAAAEAKAKEAAEKKRLAAEQAAAEAKAKEAAEAKKEEKKVVEVKKEKKDVELKPMPMPMFSYVEDASEEDLANWLPAKYKNSLVADKENIYIHAVDGESWLTYKSDDSPTKKFILRQGRSVLIRGNDVRIFLGNANITRIFYNNKLIKPITSSGVKSLVFPVELAQSIQIPLFIYNDDGTVSTSME